MGWEKQISVDSDLINEHLLLTVWHRTRENYEIKNQIYKIVIGKIIKINDLDCGISPLHSAKIINWLNFQNVI